SRRGFLGFCFGLRLGFSHVSILSKNRLLSLLLRFLGAEIQRSIIPQIVRLKQLNAWNTRLATAVENEPLPSMNE
ncbi:MAG: hypothetical protein IJ087_03265, partial [Eggerthellaceae bacterium]|nr:hypothetical protein [Eggerthellaceae bacterium]